MKWQSDRVYTDPTEFTREAVRDTRSHSACDIMLSKGNDFYSLQVKYRGLTSIEIELHCNGETIATFKQGKYNQHIKVTSLEDNNQWQKNLTNMITTQLNDLYADLRI